MNVVIALALLSALLAPDRTSAASFNCSKARTPVERLICGDARLSRADEALAGLYRAQLDKVSEAGHEQLRLDEREWLKGLSSDCSLKSSARKNAVECLADGYAARTSDLRNAVQIFGSRIFLITQASPKSAAIRIDNPTSPEERRWNAMMAKRIASIAESVSDPGMSETTVVPFLWAQNSDFIDVEISSGYYDGGPHIYYSRERSAYSLRLGREIAAGDLIKDSSRDAVARLALGDMKSTIVPRGDDPKTYISATDFRASIIDAGDWAYTNAGMRFDFYPGQFGGYVTASGLVQWSRLASYLKPNAPVDIHTLQGPQAPAD